MKKIITIILCVFLLTGCDPKSTDTTSTYKLPPQLSNCKVFQLTNSHGGIVTALVCPNSTTSTTYSSGKTTATVVTFNGA